MERLDKIKMAIDKGITCNIITGKVYGVTGKELITKNMQGYSIIAMSKDGKRVSLSAHQFIYYISTGRIVEQIDHINGDKGDNRIENLREVTQSQNQRNRVNAKGYHWNKKNENWMSQIKIDGKTKYLGSFTTEQEAHQAYLDAKKIYHNI